MTMITVEHVNFSYPKQEAWLFSDFTMALEPGRIYGLLGPNGAGKSTLLYLMAGLLTPATGRVLVDGVDVSLRRPSTMRQIFIVPDEFRLPSVTLSQYVRTESVFYPGFSIEDMRHYLSVFGMDGDPRLDTLSLGQGKKVFMSFAMATHTRVLLMDEPTNGLDIPGKERFRRFLREGRREDSLFVISTHQVKDIEQVLEHIVMVDNNRIVADVHADAARFDGEIDLERFFNDTLRKEENHEH